MYPSELKLVGVVPIFKTGDLSDLTNYRPISVLTFGKCFFNVYNKILDFISENNGVFLTPVRFLKSRSTQQAIITLVDKITKSQDIGDIVKALMSPN